jgi:hypothetical protein
VAITQGNILDDSVHPNQEKYPNQRLLVVKIKEYAYRKAAVKPRAFRPGI